MASSTLWSPGKLYLLEHKQNFTYKAGGSLSLRSSYKVRSGTVKATQRNPVSKKKKKNGKILSFLSPQPKILCKVPKGRELVSFHRAYCFSVCVVWDMVSGSLNLLCSWGWTWISDLFASILQVLGSRLTRNHFPNQFPLQKGSSSHYQLELSVMANLGCQLEYF